MVEYTKQELRRRLKDRWEGVEEQLKALISIIKANEKWYESKEYETLRPIFEWPPEDMRVERDLRGADLKGARLEGANLEGARLEGANLEGAELKGAILREANLTGTTGLSEGQLAGVVLSGAKLPEEIHSFEGLKNVEEASKNARKLFLSMLLGCAYAVLTIATTIDARLLTNSASSPLPIIRTPIPIVGFYWAAPLLLFGLYIYFHMYLQDLWERLAVLPAVFPDGRPLDKAAYPWLLNSLVCAHFTRLRDNRPPLSRLKVGLSVLLAWWVVPGTLLLFWGRYLRRQDWSGTGLHIVLLAVSVGAAIMLYRLAAATLRGKDRESFFWRKAWKDVRTYKLGVVFLGIGIVFCCLSLGAIHGVQSDPWNVEDWNVKDVRTWVPRAFALIGYSAFADLREVDVSTKPENWTGGQKEDEIALVKGAYLRGRNLRYARAYGAFLVRADLGGADLRGANLSEANLSEADLMANLSGANLSGANLSGADLRYAYLGSADLSRAKLNEADLSFARLRGADLRGAKLSGADLSGAKLSGADLSYAILYSADLSYADLSYAILHSAHLSDANLSGAQLLSIKSFDADFTDVRWWEAKIDEGSEFHAYLRKNFPRVSDSEVETPSESKEAREKEDADE